MARAEARVGLVSDIFLPIMTDSHSPKVGFGNRLYAVLYAMKFSIYTSSITRYTYAIAHGEHGAMFDDSFVKHGYLEEMYEEEHRERNRPVVKTWYNLNY